MLACLECTVHSESEELMCPGPLRALVSLESKACWGQRAEGLSFVSLGGQMRDSVCKVDSLWLPEACG